MLLHPPPPRFADTNEGMEALQADWSTSSYPETTQADDAISQDRSTDERMEQEEQTWSGEWAKSCDYLQDDSYEPCAQPHDNDDWGDGELFGDASDRQNRLPFTTDML